MWVFKYFVCLFARHNFVGSRHKYCLRCGKLEIEHSAQPVQVHVE